MYRKMQIFVSGAHKLQPGFEQVNLSTILNLGEHSYIKVYIFNTYYFHSKVFIKGYAMCILPSSCKNSPAAVNFKKLCGQFHNTHKM